MIADQIYLFLAPNKLNTWINIVRFWVKQINDGLIEKVSEFLMTVIHRNIFLGEEVSSLPLIQRH